MINNNKNILNINIFIKLLGIALNSSYFEDYKSLFIFGFHFLNNKKKGMNNINVN